MDPKVYLDGEKLYLFRRTPVPDLVELGVDCNSIHVGFPVPIRWLKGGKIFIDDTKPIIFGSVEEAIETIRNNFDEYYERFSKFIKQRQRNHDEACEIIRNCFGGILASCEVVKAYEFEPFEGATFKSYQYNLVLKVHDIENLCTLSINGVDIDAQINLMLVDTERIYVEAKDVTPDSDFMDFFRLSPPMIHEICSNKHIKPIIIC